MRYNMRQNEVLCGSSRVEKIYHTVGSFYRFAPMHLLARNSYRP